MEKSSTYPWFLDYKRSKVVRVEDGDSMPNDAIISEGDEASPAEAKPTVSSQTCTVYRDFETAWTEI